MADITEKSRISLTAKVFIAMFVFFAGCCFFLGELYGKVKSLPERVDKIEAHNEKKKTREQQICRVLQKIQYSTVPRWYQEEMKCEEESR